MLSTVYPLWLLNCKKIYYYQLGSTLLPGGAAGAVSRITGALGKGIATLTMDEDYQKKRREALNRQPADFKEGLARGGKGLVMVIPYSILTV